MEVITAHGRKLVVKDAANAGECFRRRFQGHNGIFKGWCIGIGLDRVNICAGFFDGGGKGGQIMLGLDVAE